MNKALWAGAAAFSVAGSFPALALPADFQARADALLESSYPADGPGAAVIVTDDGQVVYARGRGVSDLAARTPITPATVFRLGSITKQFSAAVMLQLANEGKLSLDDKLSKFFPAYPRPGADATVRQLLNHTVGIQSYTGIPGWMVEANTNRPYTTEQMMAVFRDLPAPSKPGERFEYNNSGYVLVGAVIEKVTGKPWHEVVEERIARPLGLTSIRYGALEAATPAMAKGYTGGEKGPELARKIHMSVPHAAGALIGSVEDLAKWNHALHHGKVVPPALYAQMIAPTKLPDGKLENYGFGIAPREVRERKAIGHGGGIFGFSTASIYVPEEDVFVAVFANSDDPATNAGLVMQRLAAMALGDPYPTFKQAKIPIQSHRPLFGVYALKEGERRFFERGGKLYTRRSGGSELEAFAAGNDRFFYGPNNLTWFEFKRAPGGKPVMAMHHEGMDEAELSTRVGPIPPEPKAVALPRSTLERYVGRYKADRGPVSVALGDDGALTLRLGGQPPVALKALSETEFAPRGVDARLVFQLEQGRPARVVLKQGGNEIVAERVAD